MLLSRLSEDNKKRFLYLECSLAYSDGEILDAEKRVVDSHCAEMGIVNDYTEGVVKSLDALLSDIKQNFSKKEIKISFVELISVVLADGVYDEEEKAFVSKVKQMLEIPDEISERGIQIMANLMKDSEELDHFVEW